MITIPPTTFFGNVRTFIDNHKDCKVRKNRRLETKDSQGTEDDMTKGANKRKRSSEQVDGSNASTQQNKRHKPRIHPKEAGHRIDNLPSQSQAQTESEDMSAAELVKSLGLEVNGVGRSAELWYVGSGEQQELDDSFQSEKEGTDLPTELEGPSMDGLGEEKSR